MRADFGKTGKPRGSSVAPRYVDARFLGNGEGARLLGNAWHAGFCEFQLSAA